MIKFNSDQAPRALDPTFPLQTMQPMASLIQTLPYMVNAHVFQTPHLQTTWNAGFQL